MKRKFFLHRQNQPLTTDTVIYRVWIGESVREQRILTQLMSWAFKTGATLRSWSEDIDFFLLFESERVFHECGILNFGFASADLTASEALSLAEGDLWSGYENDLTMPKAFFDQINTLYPGHLLPKNSPKGDSSVLAEPRKYLNQKARGGKHVIRFT